MNLNDQQKQTVKKWVDEGKSVSEIQKLISSEFGVDMLYMDVRFLIDDIGAEIPSAAEQQQASVAPDAPQGGAAGGAEIPTAEANPASDAAISGEVSVSVSPIQRPGSMMSGNVVFSDGGRAEWILDNTGRLGLNPETEGYTPPQQDIPVFQQKLQEALGFGQ